MTRDGELFCLWCRELVPVVITFCSLGRTIRRHRSSASRRCIEWSHEGFASNNVEKVHIPH